MDLSTIIGLTAATFATIAFIPQALKVVKTKQTRDLSLKMYAIFAIGVFLWIIYGYMISSLPVLLANIITFILVVMILWMKLKYG